MHIDFSLLGVGLPWTPTQCDMVNVKTIKAIKLIITILKEKIIYIYLGYL